MKCLSFIPSFNALSISLSIAIYYHRSSLRSSVLCGASNPLPIFIWTCDYIILFHTQLPFYYSSRSTSMEVSFLLSEWLMVLIFLINRFSVKFLTVISRLCVSRVQFSFNVIFYSDSFIMVKVFLQQYSAFKEGLKGAVLYRIIWFSNGLLSQWLQVFIQPKLFRIVFALFGWYSITSVFRCDKAPL